MTTVQEIYTKSDTELSFEEFKDRVETKVDDMNGLVDAPAAAHLVANDLGCKPSKQIEDITAEMKEIRFAGKVVSVGELTTFERDTDDGFDSSEGRVCNVEIADETGQLKVAFWDADADKAATSFEVGDTLKITGNPKDGFNGLEVSATEFEQADDIDIDVKVLDTYRVADLSAGLSSVTIKGLVLGLTTVNTFERNDGSEGRVSNLIIGDPTGEVKVTMWGDAADAVDNFEQKQSVKVTNGNVREGDSGLEIHISSPTDIEHVREQIEYIPETTAIEDVSVDDVANIAGVITFCDDLNTFERDDGSESRVRNITLKDDTDSIRASLWGTKADMRLEAGFEVLVTNAEIQEGWEGEPEASAGYNSAVVITGRSSVPTDEDEKSDGDESSSQLGEYDKDESEEAATDDQEDEDEDELVEIQGMVMGKGETFDVNVNGEDFSVHGTDDYTPGLGERVVVRGHERDDGSIEATEIFAA